MKFWTKDRCISIARNCKSRSEFKKKYSGAWDFAFNNNILGEIYCYLENPNNLKIIWTKEKCKIICDKYMSYSEFRKKEPKVYDALLNKKWLKELCGHMVRIKKEKLIKQEKSFDNNRDRVIYSFEFSDNNVYVGLTCSPETRKRIHTTNKKSAVYKYITISKLIPEFKILTSFMAKEVASLMEGEILDEYKNNNWNILNKNKTGGLGGTILIWDENNVKLEALKYMCRSEFKKNSPSAYKSACNNKWLNRVCEHMKFLQLPNGFWKNDKEKCFNEAKKYKKISHFKLNSPGAFNAINSSGWYREIKEIFEQNK